MVKDSKAGSLEWREAQRNIALFLENASFKVWQERVIKNKRIDILAKREFKNKTFYLIFEVKHYEAVSGSNEREFFYQLKEYMKELILRELEHKSIAQIREKYVFVGYLVFSKGYGIYKNRQKNWKKGSPFPIKSTLNEIWKRNVHFFCSTQEYIKQNLETLGLFFYSQPNLSNFFN
ncbi:MAG: hypothetical protein ACTSQE_03625 [Candidatus Heimdallarchaeaceae archaeon]